MNEGGAVARARMGAVDWQNEWGRVAFRRLGQCYHTGRVQCDNTEFGSRILPLFSYGLATPHPLIVSYGDLATAPTLLGGSTYSPLRHILVASLNTAAASPFWEFPLNSSDDQSGGFEESKNRRIEELKK